MTKHIFIRCLLFLSGAFLGGCRQPQVEGGATRKTFVLSDTMLKSIRIDTANVKPVQIALHFSGKVSGTRNGLKDMGVMVDINAADLSKLKEGYDADVTVEELPDRVFHGRIDKVHPLPDSSAQVRIKLDSPYRELKPRMFTTVTLILDEGDDMVAVPETAVIADHSRNFVLVFKNKYNVQVREVETYRTTGELTYISKGLRPGENVISMNQLQIYNALSD